MKRILIVEDDPCFAELLTLYLSQLYAVTAVDNGEEALEWLRNDSADVVVMDFSMPRVSGIELLRRMSEETDVAEKPAVLIVTAARLDRETLAGLTRLYNVQGYVDKALGIWPALLDRIESITGPRPMA